VEFWDDCGYMLMRERPADTNAVLAEHLTQAASAPQRLQRALPAIEPAAPPLVPLARARLRSTAR
jgi:hypothetical protein